MKTLILLLILTSSLLFFGCSHTNNFINNDMTGKRVLFEEIISGDAATVRINLAEPKNDNQSKAKKGDSEEKKEKGSTNILDLPKEIGKSIAIGTVESKLIDAANPEELTELISDVIENNLIKFYSVKSTREVRDKFEFICTTELNKLEIISNPDGMYLYMKVKSYLINNEQGKIIWENSESSSVPFRRLNYSPDDKSYTETAISNIAQLTDIVLLSEEKIRLVVRNAVREIGLKMTKTLTDDILEAKRGSN